MSSLHTTAVTPMAQDELLSRLAAYRDRVVPLIHKAIPDREPKQHLYDLVSAQLSREGKGIRPALCLATCHAFGGDAARALPSAAAIELLHNAFLVHDDIEDESQYRRDQPTLNRQYGVPLAVNVGDAMNAMSVRLLRKNLELLGPELTSRVFDEMDHMSLQTIEGQAMELGWIRENNCRTTEEDYLLMVLKKTSWYSFIHPARIGALIAQPGAIDLDSFNRFGSFLGTAFQIQDDVLNLTGNQGKYGKEIGGDLYEGKRTLILAHLFKSANEREREKLEAFFAKTRTERTPQDVAWIYEVLGAHGSIEYARSAARQFAEGARREFESAYTGASDVETVRFLRSLIDYMVSREM